MKGNQVNISIIGANGFVGTALTMHLQMSGVSVRAFGRHEFDLSKPHTWTRKLEGSDCVVNCAAQIDGDALDIFQTNALTAEAFAEHLNLVNVPRLINLSTGAVYGPSDHAASPETPSNPQGYYAVSKLISEKVLERDFLGELVNLRLYFPYGANQKFPRLLPRLAQSIEREQTVFCGENGGPFLSVSYVNDISEVILKDFITGQKEPGIYNIASNHVVGVEDMLKQLAFALDRPLKLERRGRPVNCISQPYSDFAWREFAIDQRLARSLLAN